MAISKEQLALMKEAQRLMKLLNYDQEVIRNLQIDIYNGLIKTNAELQKEIQERNKIIQQTSTQASLEKEIADAKNDILDLTKELQKPLTKISNITDEILEKDLAKIQAGLRNNAITTDEAHSLEQQLKTLNKIAKNPLMKVGFEKAANTLADMEAMFGRFIPGIEGISARFEKALLNGFSPVKAVIGVGLVAILGSALAVLKSITDEANKFAESTGVTFSQAREIADQARSTSNSLSLQLTTYSDILAVQEAIIKSFGNVQMITTDIAANIAEVAQSFNYTNATAASVTEQMLAMGVAGNNIASQQEEIAAAAYKAGVNVGTVMQDIATNSKLVAKYFGGNVKALGDAAVQAAKLGISLQNMSTIADKLLDIQSSLEAQFEFQALSGRQINLDKARELALTGDIANATQEIYSQVGGITEFNKLNTLERKKLAELMGMEVSELQKSLAIQEKLGSITEEQRVALNGMGLTAAEIKNMDAATLRSRLANQQSLEEAQRSMSVMKSQLTNALVPLAETFGKIMSGLAPAFKLVGIILTPIVDALTGVLKLITFSTDGLTNMQKILGAITGIYLGWKAIQLASIIREKQILSLKIGQAAMTQATVAPLLGLAAAAGVIALGYKFLNTGDLAIPAGNGPIVMSPREGTIFQGTSNDDVAMGPGVIQAAQASSYMPQNNASDGDSIILLKIIADELRGIRKAMLTPVPVQIGDRVINEIGTKLAVSRTYRSSNGGL